MDSVCDRVIRLDTGMRAERGEKGEMSAGKTDNEAILDKGSQALYLDLRLSLK